MSAYLTDAERETLTCDCATMEDSPTWSEMFCPYHTGRTNLEVSGSADALVATVERILTDRLAAVEAGRDDLQRQFRELQSESRILPCDGGCFDAPEEDCSRHGREPADLWRIISEIAAERDRLAAVVERVRAVLGEWGAIATDGDFVSDEDFAEAIRDSGAWRLARDLRAALDHATEGTEQ